MPLLDLAELLAPISDAAPAGGNLEYAGVAELDRLATGNPGALDPKTREMVGAEEPEWRKVRDAAIALLRQTKDVRAAVILNRALLALHGLPGLGEGLQLVHGLLTTFWDSAYPQLDKDEGDDPVERLNALANLSDPDGLLRTLRSCRIAESREVGQFTSRDLDLASGRIASPEGVEPPTPALLSAAWVSGDSQANSARQRGVESALQAIDDLEALFRARAGEAPSLGGLRTALNRIKGFYDEVAPALAAQAEGAGNSPAANESVQAVAVGDGAKGNAPLASRADAVKSLQRIADFIRKTEPSSPAPLFVDRAIKVLQMDFASIVMELMPDAKDRIEMLGGVSLDAP